jgi:glutathione S-transferase
LVHAGLHNAGGFPERVSKHLSKKYGYSPEAGAAAGPRVAELLRMLIARLKAQHQAGSRYYVGNSLTVTDVYSATFAAMFDPLPPEQCKMDASTRTAFNARDAHTEAALNPILFEHRNYDVQGVLGVAALALSTDRPTARKSSSASCCS